ncbi:hypothetical protein NHX12_033678 [Muraenolepis orangiensis]|uniref:Uncharacterized protein n=1 Tax=Muraenolepis orangiensis TaxID=630683 RepID=A0A9Q0E2S2_9TELE|nr:hypothetical protein NHX12_033678 [Muraenolepis orangiensis]
MLLTAELVPGGEERRCPARPSRRAQSKTSQPPGHANPGPPTPGPRTQGEEKEKERRKQQKEKRETQVKREKTGGVEVKVVDKTEETVRSPVVDMDSVREKAGEVGEGEEKKVEEESRGLLQTDRQDVGLSFCV